MGSGLLLLPHVRFHPVTSTPSSSLFPDANWRYSVFLPITWLDHDLCNELLLSSSTPKDFAHNELEKKEKCLGKDISWEVMDISRYYSKASFYLLLSCRGISSQGLGHPGTPGRCQWQCRSWAQMLNQLLETWPSKCRPNLRMSCSHNNPEH